MAKSGITQEQMDSNAKIMSIYLAIVSGIIAMYLLGYSFYLADYQHVSMLDAIQILPDEIMKGKFLFPLTQNALTGIGAGVLIGGIVYFMATLDNQKRRHYDDNTVAGSAGFMDAKEMKAYAEQFIAKDPPPIVENLPVASSIEGDKGKYSENMIMSNKFCRPINSRALIGNNNVLIVGGAGTGKSRFFIKPNMLQMNASYVITDPSGEMIFSLGKTLKDHGYKIKIFNISDMSHSNCYNPLNYIRDEAGVNMLIQCFITNTTQGEGGGDNQFFVDAEKLLYSACIFYLIDFCNDDTQKNFANILNMINASSVNEMDPNAKSPLDALFDKLPQNSLAWKYYKAFKQAAGKTLKSIIISCVTRLQPFMTPQVINLTKRDDLDLGSIGNEKTALFIITPQADRTYSFLASMLYSQLFETLYHIGEKQKANGESEQLKVPVRCMMDEFANIGEVPEFPSRLATMRKYNISAAIVLQDISQIEAMYEETWKTLVGNCSTMVFLGTQEPNTLEYFSKMLGEMTVTKRSRNPSKGKGGDPHGYQQDKRAVMTPDELGRMSPTECIVFTQNRRPVKDKKYKYERHPYYPQTADADNSKGFQYNKLSIYDNSRSVGVENILKAEIEAKAFKERMAKRANNPGNVKTSADILRGDEKSETKMYKDCLQACQINAASAYTDAVCMLLVDSVPTNILSKLVNEVSATLRKYPMMIFTDVSYSERQDYIAGIGIDDEKGSLGKVVDNEFAKSKKKGKYYLVSMHRSKFEQYKEKVLQDME